MRRFCLFPSFNKIEMLVFRKKETGKGYEKKKAV